MTEETMARTRGNGDARPVLSMDVTAVAQLAELGARFVWWKLVPDRKSGKPRKLPFTKDGTAASSTDPATWSTLQECQEVCRRRRGAGVGIVFNGDGLAGVDLDGCRDPATGEVAKWAAKIVRQLGSYTEVSPSGTGLKVYLRVDPVRELRANKRTIGKAEGEKVPAVELYVTGRYFALTGEHLDCTPDEITDATEAFERLAKWVADGAKGAAHADLPQAFVRLLERDGKLRRAWEEGVKLGNGGDTSASALDAALAAYLARHLSDPELAEVLRRHRFGQIGGGKLSGKAADRRVGRLLAIARDARATGGHDALPAPQGARRQGRFAFLEEGAPGRSAGVYRIVEDKSGGRDWKWLCSHLEVAAETRNADGEDWGRLLVVVDRDGQVHQWAMPASLLAGDGIGYRERLLSMGLLISPGSDARISLAEYLTVWRAERQARCVDRVGWHGDAFVLPDRTYGATGGEDVVLQPVGDPPRFDHRGTLEGWQEELGALAAGNARLVFMLALALAGPFLRPLHEESGGFHLAGASSIGKSTAVKVAASVWGSEAQSWRTTDNAAETLALGACDLLLTLDEIGEADGRTVDQLAYMLSNGQGKARMRRDTSARPVSRWRLLFLSTGEKGLAAKMQEANKRAQAGQSVRVVELPADAGKGLGLFQELHDWPDPDALSRALRQAADRHRGALGRAFLTRITTDPAAAVEWVKARRREWIEAEAPAGSPGQVTRVAGRFALVAAVGELAIEYGLVPWMKGEAAKAARELFQAWIAQRGGLLPAEIRDGVNQVRAFLELHGSSRFEDAWRQKPAPGKEDEPTLVKTINRVGFRRLITFGADEAWEYYVFREAWRLELCRGFNANTIASAMAQAKWLDTGEGKNLARTTRVPGVGKDRFFVVTPAFMSSDLNELAVMLGMGWTGDESQ